MKGILNPAPYYICCVTGENRCRRVKKIKKHKFLIRIKNSEGTKVPFHDDSLNIEGCGDKGAGSVLFLDSVSVCLGVSVCVSLELSDCFLSTPPPQRPPTPCW